MDLDPIMNMTANLKYPAQDSPDRLIIRSTSCNADRTPNPESPLFCKISGISNPAKFSERKSGKSLNPLRIQRHEKVSL